MYTYKYKCGHGIFILKIRIELLHDTNMISNVYKLPD